MGVRGQSWAYRHSGVLVLGVVLLSGGFLILVSSITLAQGVPPPPSSVPAGPATPIAHPTPLPQPRSVAEALQQRAQQLQDLAATGQSVSVSGPSTRGSVIQIQGKSVQLPPDAYVSRYITSGLCAATRSCPELPMYELRRGNSTLAVSAPSGAKVEEQIAPGEAGAFDFLNAVLQ